MKLEVSYFGAMILHKLFFVLLQVVGSVFINRSSVFMHGVKSFPFSEFHTFDNMPFVTFHKLVAFVTLVAPNIKPALLKRGVLLAGN